MGEELRIIDVSIPQEVADLKLPAPELVDYYNDMHNRVIYIDYEIDNGLMREVGRQIIEYNRVDKGKPRDEREPIVILINSWGGDLNATYATIAVMETSITPVITVNMNSAYSAAGLLLMAGHKRYCMPRSQVLIHSGSAQGIGGNYEEIQESTKSYKKMVEEMREFVVSKTKIDKALMKKNQTRDWYIDSSEQITLGCADEVLTDINQIL